MAVISHCVYFFLKMWLQYQQSNLTELFQAALVKLCLENVPFTGNLELDGLFCISNGDISKQIVVKIHKVIQPSLTNQSKSRSILKINQVSVDSDVHKLKDMSLQMGAEIRKQKVEENTGCRSEHSTDFSNGAKDSNVAGRTDDGIAKTENKILLELPTSTMNLSSAIKKTPLPFGINFSKHSSVMAESLGSSEISCVKEEMLEVGLSSGEDDSVNELFLIQDSTCGQTHKEIKCKLCQMNSSDINELEAHMREIHGRFLCRQCLTTFSLSCNLRRHMKLHTGVRPHVCDACQSSFSRSTDLKIHMRKHSTGKDSFTCSLCVSVFSNSYLLSLHKVKVHGASEELVNCNQCEKQFSSGSQLKLHKKTHRDSSAGDARGCLDAQMFTAEAEEDAASFEDGNGSSSSDAWPSAKALQRTSKDQSPDELLEQMETDVKPNLPFDCKGNPACNGNAEKGLADVHKTISDSYLETVKEFAPLFSISDSDVRSSNCFQPKYPDDSTVISSPEQRQQSHSVPTTGKNKRKGMPVKHVKCSENGMYEEMAEEEQLSDEGLVVDDSVPSFNGTISNENIPVCDDLICEDLTYCKPPVVSSLSATRKGVFDSRIGTKPEMEEDNMFRDSSETVCLNNNDVESRVFTCRHGGCSTSWFGFGAYETHYVSAHCRYPCELCDQSFTSRNNRRRHANGHGNVKKHSCDRCDKLFARPDIVKEHRITHTRSYQSGQCCKCHFSCAKKTMLLSHLKRCLAADDIDSDIGK